MGSAHEKHLKKPHTTSSGDVKGSQKKGETQRIAKRWNTLPPKVDITSMDLNDVYVLGAFIIAIKIRM
jgi:hypothetical protein